MKSTKLPIFVPVYLTRTIQRITLCGISELNHRENLGIIGMLHRFLLIAVTASISFVCMSQRAEAILTLQLNGHGVVNHFSIRGIRS